MDRQHENRDSDHFYPGWAGSMGGLFLSPKGETSLYGKK